MVFRSIEGKLFATGGTKGIIQVWDALSCRLVASSDNSYVRHSHCITSIAFSSFLANDNEVFLISVSEDGAMYMWKMPRF